VSEAVTADASSPTAKATPALTKPITAPIQRAG
jgi:hypothetical protein